jgi:hypothetical protein
VLLSVRRQIRQSLVLVVVVVEAVEAEVVEVEVVVVVGTPTTLPSGHATQASRPLGQAGN